MKSMPYIAPEVVQEVKRMDLLTYLKNYEPQELVHFSGNTYTTRSHDSLKISNGKWMWWSQSIGGRSALDYLIKVRGYSFMEAIEIIAGQAAIQPPVSASVEQKTEKVLLLPKPYRYTEYVVSYLKNRGIDMELIDFCLKTGRLYESAEHHNAVFVGRDQEISHGMQHFGEWKQISSEKQAEVINTIHFVFQRKEFVVKYTYLNQRLICYRMPRWRSWMGKTGEKRICYLLRGFTDRHRNLRKVRYLLHWFVS